MSAACCAVWVGVPVGSICSWLLGATVVGAVFLWRRRRRLLMGAM